MALIHSLEKSGNTLFRNRGQMPVILFIIAIPIIYFTDYSFITNTLAIALSITAIVISLIGFLIRAYSIATTPKGTSGRNTNEQVAESLNTSGIYSMLRHPLYLGNYLMWIGIVIFTFNIYFFFIVSLIFWLYYERIMFAEERFLEKKFGNDYLEWSKTVPAFIPSFKHFKKNEIPFSFKSVLRREYSGVLATAFGFAFIDLLRIYFIEKKIEWQRVSVYAVIAAFILVIILRTIKHTGLLNEEGRS
ncbi:MAG: isoprenylcysteine carboxylmethyltransferase family protein [Bacteroidales bacterium]|jgi:protein-S-isoprenylcysteine O-methyltransferase Ste14